MRLRLLLASCLLASCLLAGAARATDVDATSVARLAGGPPQSVPRGDRGRTGRAHRLPDAPTLAFRTRVAGGLTAGVAATATSFVAVTADDHLVFLSSMGREVTRLPLGAPAATAPVIGPSGDVVVLTDAGDVVAVTATGRLRYRARIDGGTRDMRVGPLPMPDGGVVVARGSLLLRLDDEGRTMGRGRAPEMLVGALVGDGAAVLATTDVGRVVRWDGLSEPRALGRLGGSPTVGAAFFGRTLTAVVDAHRLVMFDVAAGAPSAVVELSAQLDAPAIGPGGEVLITTGGGALVTFAPDGRELARVALPAGPARALLTGGATGDAGAIASSPPVLVDEDGRVGFVRPTGEVGVITPPATVVAEERACAHPIALGASESRLLVSCSDGTLAVYAEPLQAAP